jgi:hypothetical protein
MDNVHGGATWRIWAKEVLTELNEQPEDNMDLPPSGIVRVIMELFDEDDFARGEKQREPALEELNRLLARDHPAAYFDDAGCCFVRNTGTGTASTKSSASERPLSKEEHNA